MLIDPFKVTRWKNTRKLTPKQLAEHSGLPLELIASALSGNPINLEPAVAGALAAALEVDPSQLAAGADFDQAVVVRMPAELQATRRTVTRDGIPFYNYYTMATPPGRAAPVILDVLCPTERLPMLNNGHMEPAITVNLGPGDINGRWGEILAEDTWTVLRANSDPDRWITGDSYTEPSYCPHAYSLASKTPARIVSYTAHPNLAPLTEDANKWPEQAFSNFATWLGEGVACGAVLDLLLARRGYDRRSAAAQAGLSPEDVDRAIKAPLQDVATLHRLGQHVGLDYRLLLPPAGRHDSVGKTSMSIDETRATTRDFGPYLVASMAGAAHLPDLTGLFVKVGDDRPGDSAYLTELADSHYLVIEGEVSLEWVDSADDAVARKLSVNASAWVAPFVRHRWAGHGALLKFGSGKHPGYQDLFELTNTYAPADTLRRSHRDIQGWGYDA